MSRQRASIPDCEEAQDRKAADRTVFQLPGTPVTHDALAVEQHAVSALSATAQTEIERFLRILTPCKNNKKQQHTTENHWFLVRLHRTVHGEKPYKGARLDEKEK